MSALPTMHETGITGEDAAAYRALARLLDHAPVRLVDAEGKIAPVPTELHETMRTLVALLAADKAALITPLSRDLTTQQAANLLGVSRPTLIRLLDNGAIPYTRVRSHRRIRLADLLAYRDADRTERRQRIDELVRMSEETGEYDVTEDQIAAFRASVSDDDAMFDEDALG